MNPVASSSSKSTPSTKRKRAGGAKPNVSKKRKGGSASQALDKAVQEFWNAEKTAVLRSALIIDRSALGTCARYQHMFLGLRLDDEGKERPYVPVPTGQDGDEKWEETGWSLFVPDSGGMRGAVEFPLKCQRYTHAQFEALALSDQWRCVEDPPHWYYVDRNDIHGDKLQFEFMANAVRAAGPGEKANCRIVLDWEWTPERGLERRCVLISTMKCEKGHEWRYDADFARRSQLPEESSSDSSVEVVPEAVSSSRVQLPVDVSKGALALDREALDRLVGTAESCCVHLATIEGLLKDLVPEIKGARADNLETRRLCIREAGLTNAQMARSWLEIRRIIGPINQSDAPSDRQVFAAAANPDISMAEIAALAETEEQRSSRFAAERLLKRREDFVRVGRCDGGHYTPTGDSDGSEPEP